ncbi:MAG: peptide chain release factor N(5)-glutamine methyltransferase [Lachnospiraceae bacterium]|nr:peptide chain release factor N(5)-glutamine methyltransferase [Lachnospiraceae bacterium]
MTTAELIKRAVAELEAVGIEHDDAVSDTRFLLCDALDIEYKDLLLMQGKEADEADKLRFEEYIKKRRQRIPCQYITGKAYFMGRVFTVAEGVLVPRPETELLVENAVKLADSIDGSRQGLRVLDLCTGSGCIGISFFLERGCVDEVKLSDISYDALKTTAKNRDRLAPEVGIVKSDLFNALDERFDIILSNPPYIKSSDIEELVPEVKDREPRLALDGKNDGLYFYRRIIDELEEHLYDNGICAFEIGYDQGEAVGQLLVDAGFKDVSVIKDYADLDRIVTGKLA